MDNTDSKKESLYLLIKKSLCDKLSNTEKKYITDLSEIEVLKYEWLDYYKKSK